MSLRKMSAIVPDVLAEIERMIAREKRERDACDPVVENRPVDPRKRVGRARRVRGEQLELQLHKEKLGQ
tara:strand:+ start:11012 stop:11218 length:207 start_codon:yes stop_codon:yes gene_type:complete